MSSQNSGRSSAHSPSSPEPSRDLCSKLEIVVSTGVVGGAHRISFVSSFDARSKLHIVGGSVWGGTKSSRADPPSFAPNDALVSGTAAAHVCSSAVSPGSPVPGPSGFTQNLQGRFKSS